MLVHEKETAYVGQGSSGGAAGTKGVRWKSAAHYYRKLLQCSATTNGIFVHDLGTIRAHWYKRRVMLSILKNIVIL